MEKLIVYAHMKSHEDTSESKYQGPANRISSLAVEFSAAESFVTPELLTLPESTLQEYIKNPLLADYAFGLKELLRQREHVLSQAEEAILARSDGWSG